MSAAQRPSDRRREHLAKVVGRSSEPTHTPPPAAPADPASGQRRRRTPRPSASGGPTDHRPALARRSTVKQQQGINFDLALLEYAREAVAYMGRRHPEEAGSESLAALVDQAIREKITAWERKYSDGESLPQL